MYYVYNNNRRKNNRDIKKITHPNRQILDEIFDESVEISGVSEFERIKYQDMKANVCAIVMTIQSFRFDK
jgi:hypothetical protein